MRIAAIQLDFLPSYFSTGSDYLCYPLTASIDTGSISGNDRLTQWRTHLRTTYCRLFGVKLHRILQFCVAEGADLIVLPEYSVPPECLQTLRSVSHKVGAAIIAGSHRFDASRSIFLDTLPEMGALDVHGRAISPIFVHGQASIVTKLTGSPYDPDVAGPSLSPADRAHFTFGGLKARVWICSDFLQARRRKRDSAQLQIVICYTPAVGDFASRLSAESLWDDTLRNAHASQKEPSYPITVFVNNAKRGGTKVFFNNRSRRHSSLDASDGTYGDCVLVGNVVKRCGLPAGTEAIVMVDIHVAGDRLRCEQSGLIPILHCSGPDDPVIRAITELFSAFDAAHGLRSKREALQAHLPSLVKLASSPTYQLLDANLSHLAANLDVVYQEDILGGLLSKICLIHEDSPSLSSWRQRSSSATLSLLRDIRDTSPVGDEAVDSCIRVIQASLLQAPVGREVGTEQDIAQLIAPMDLLDYLELPGWFCGAVANSRSGSESSRKGVEFIHHVLSSGDPTAALTFVDRLRRHRPYAAFQILNGLERLLRATHPDFQAARDACEAFLEDRVQERAAMRSACSEAATLLEPELLLFGYSEMVLLLLRSLVGPKLPLVIAECRNRTPNWGGVALARAATDAGFPVTFISDASIGGRLAAPSSRRVKTILMGFNIGGPQGAINTVGALGVAVLGKHYGARVMLVGQTFKLLARDRWDILGRNALATDRNAPWLDQSARRLLHGVWVEDPQSDCVPWSLVDTIVTEDGVFTGVEIADRLTIPSGDTTEESPLPR